MAKPVPECGTCGKKGESDCSRVECGNRKTVTAAIRDGATHRGMGGGSVRLCVMRDEDYFREFDAREKD
jgi:hypothetical protein